jgi:hypothetical protein
VRGRLPATDGALALADPGELWVDMPSRRRPDHVTTPDVSSRLSAPPHSGSVRPMASPRSRQAARFRARRRRAQQRARRVALLSVVTALGVVTLLLTAFGSGAPARTTVQLPRTALELPTGRPKPVVLATVSNLQIKMPVAAGAVTELGYHGSQNGALTLQALGRQANEGLLARLWHRIAGREKKQPVWYQLPGAGPRTQVLNVGARAGTDVYAPVAGSVTAITDYVVDGRRFGSRIDIRPTAAPSVIVSLTHVRPDRSLTVGAPVQAGTSKLGTVVDIASVERQALGSHTTDGGNNVAIEVHSASSTFP